MKIEISIEEIKELMKIKTPSAGTLDVLGKEITNLLGEKERPSPPKF